MQYVSSENRVIVVYIARLEKKNKLKKKTHAAREYYMSVSGLGFGCCTSPLPVSLNKNEDLLGSPPPTKLMIYFNLVKAVGASHGMLNISLKGSSLPSTIITCQSKISLIEA